MPDAIQGRAPDTKAMDAAGADGARALDRTAIYRDAIDATLATLGRRARGYRNLILVAGTGIFAAGLWAVIARSFAPLLLLVLVVASAGAFFWIDALIMNRWRARLLEPWQRRELDFSAFAAAVQAIPGLPAGTVAAMLTSLPSATDFAQERQWTLADRERMAKALLVRDRRQAIRLLFKTLVVAVGGVAIDLVLLA
jgi:hypothetical protein